MNKKLLKLLNQAVALLKGGNGDDEDGEETAEEGQVELPDSLEAINELEKSEALDLAKQMHLDIEDLKIAQVKELLASVWKVVNDQEDDLEGDEITALASAIGIAPKKKSSATVAEIKAYLTEDKEEEGDDDKDDDDDDEEASDEDDEEVTPKKKKKKSSDDDDDEDADDDSDSDDDDEDAEEDADEDDEDKPKKKKKASDEDDEDEEASDDDDEDDKDEDADEDDDEDDEGGDDVDVDKIAKKAKLPPEKTQLSRLLAYNKVAEKNEGEKINVKKLGTEKAYRELVKKLVTEEGKVAEWGKPYVANEAGFCCGLELQEVKVKGKDVQRGKCAVTGTVWDLDEDGEFSEVEE